MPEDVVTHEDELAAANAEIERLQAEVEWLQGEVARLTKELADAAAMYGNQESV